MNINLVQLIDNFTSLIFEIMKEKVKQQFLPIFLFSARHCPFSKYPSSSDVKCTTLNITFREKIFVKFQKSKGLTEVIV